MKPIKDSDSEAIFDDYVLQPEEDVYGTTHWTQVCNACAKRLHLLDSYLDTGSGSGVCGVLGCSNEADHYYDFVAEGE